jgi:ElaB/YqjD/DUF883 family membrane-anchored ribosome-binding protein
MADGNDGSSSGPETEAGGERATSVVGEFVDAARSAAESLLEEQKHQVAEKVSAIAEALRSAAHSLDQSQNRAIARYIDQTAGQIENISRTVRERRWNEIVADTEDFARRQPRWFVAGAVATGFLVGRVLWAWTGGQRSQSDPAREVSPNETLRPVAAAASSGSGTDAAAVTGDAAGSSAAEAD